jgi:uncharacterized protein (DUF1015 family)
VVDAAPFQAVRYDPGVAGDASTTSAPAYDDVGRFTYASHRAASPYTVLELLTSRGTGSYVAAGAVYERWRRTGVLVRDPAPAFYLYEEHELRAGVPAVQRGMLAAVALEPLDGTGSILPHEAVDPERVVDRLDRLSAVPLDVSPVFALYQGAGPELRTVLDRRPAHPPIVAMTDEAGIDHRIWALTSPEDVASIAAALEPAQAVIADGHHRYARALAHSHRLAQGQGGGELGASLRTHAPWRRTLMYLVDATVHGPRPMAIHRLVRRLPPDVESRLGERFELERLPGESERFTTRFHAQDGSAIALRLSGGTTFLLHPRDPAGIAALMPEGRSARWQALPTAVLDHAVLPSLGITDPEPRTDLPAAVAEVDANAGAGLFILSPTDTETVLALSAAGEPMPPKTTSFQPKPRTGLLMREVLG